MLLLALDSASNPSVSAKSLGNGASFQRRRRARSIARCWANRSHRNGTFAGWRFETTRHVVEREEDDGVETASENVLIYSRLGNSSDESLPYPVIVVALSDRFEEPVGSITLDPADYLPADMDPRKLVGPGVTFEASVTVHSPPPEATGFRLRPCYRTIGGDLRCKDAAFK